MKKIKKIKKAISSLFFGIYTRFTRIHLYKHLNKTQMEN